MHGMKNHICLLAAAAATVFSAMPPASAAVKFASPFADGMVLQRDARVAVWGTADPAEKVTVSFAGQTAVAHCLNPSGFKRALNMKSWHFSPAAAEMIRDSR